MKRKETNSIKRSYNDKIFDIADNIILVVLLFIFAWPLWFVLIASFSDYNAVASGQVILWPKGLTLGGYQEVFKYNTLWTGYANTIFYSVVGTAINMIMTVC